MNRFTFFIFIILFLVIGSCASRKKKLDNRNLIPEKKFTEILTESYIANGLYTLQDISDWYPSLDTLSSYYFIAENHGYSRDIMEKTMKYYFIKKTKKLIEIHDQILAKLSEMESLIDKEMSIVAARKANLWFNSDIYSFPFTEQTDSGNADIKIYKKGFYILSFTATFFPDDQSLNPRMTAYTCNIDSIETGKRKYIETINYIKDGWPHTYSYTIKMPVKTILNTRIWLNDYDNHPEEWEKHLMIENISFTYTPQIR